MKNAGKENIPSRAIGVIPARWGATRFPGKLLARLGDRTVIEHVYRRAAEASELDSIWVATDDTRIFREVESFGGRVIMTSSVPRTGTERTAEACRGLDAEIVVNIQGDEPFLRAGMIDSVVRELVRDPELKVATLVIKVAGGDWMDDPNQVKVVLDRKGFALYFSRRSETAPDGFPAYRSLRLPGGFLAASGRVGSGTARNPGAAGAVEGPGARLPDEGPGDGL